jgi:hypothetical protein
LGKGLTKGLELKRCCWHRSQATHSPEFLRKVYFKLTKAVLHETPVNSVVTGSFFGWVFGEGQENMLF